LNGSELSLLHFLLARHYELVFLSGGSLAHVPLGPTNHSVYTHFNFEYLKTLEEFSLYKILPSRPMNLSQGQVLGFTYETSFVATPRLRRSQPVLFSYMMGLLVVFTCFLLSLLFPKFVTKPCYVVLSLVPTHAFALSIVCGAGAGVIASVVSCVLLVITGIPLEPSNWHYWVIPQAASALVTAVVTSWLCRFWRVLDVASALYFAPLVFPSVVFGFFFSVQWISVGIGACTTVPLYFFFFGILSVVFVKIPINLVGSLVCAGLCGPIDETEISRVRVIVRRFTGSRTGFLIAAHTALFVTAFPWVQQLMESCVGIDMYFYPRPARMGCAGWGRG
jgi:hypothetical protein